MSTLQQPLSEVELRVDPDTGSTRELRDGIFILHLKGDPYSRGLAHGRLLTEEILESGVSPYYGRLLLQLLHSSELIERIPRSLRRSLGDLLEWWFYAPLEKMMLAETRDEIYGVCDALDLDRRESLRGLLAPDIMIELAMGFLKGGKVVLGNYFLGGCSGAYARKAALKNGSPALFARNMDFPGVFSWIHPSVIFSHPTEEIEMLCRKADGSFVREKKRKRPYVYITTAGFPGNGLTGMSASGVALGSFVCLSRNTSSRKLSSLDYNHYLLTRADGIPAIRRLVEEEDLTSATSHTAVFADAEEAISIEVDAAKRAVRSMGSGFDVHAQTNHYLNPVMKKDEVDFALERESTIGRFRVVRDALEASYGEIDAQRMVDIISCNTDRASGTSRLVGEFPAQSVTLQSVVFAPETGDFWMATGRPPAVCYNRYVGFNFAAEIAGEGREVRLPSYARSARPVLPGTRQTPVTDAMKASLRHFQLSQELLKRGKLFAARHALHKAIGLHADPGYEYLRGLLSLMAGETDTALAQIRETRRRRQFSGVKESALALWEARALDLLGRREEACACYRAALERPGTVRGLCEAFEKGLKRPFSARALPRSFDYNLLGPFDF